MSEYFLIGEIAGVDNDGFLSVISYSDFPDRFLRLEKVFVEIFGRKKVIVVEDAEIAGKDIFLKFENFDSAEEAEIFVNKKIFIESSEAIELEKGSFFIHDLIDCKVYYKDEFIGILKEALTLPANDVYLVRNTIGEEILIPAVKEYLKEIDVKKKIIHLNKLPEFFDDED
ncbi:MAG: 16S rRNA processing protein RimM [Chlorobi bacterium]|nr:16S rRNA processing protein RimM [Chlorobiota bacterium]